MVKRLVEITQDIIDNSMRQNSGHCMIAEAIKQQVPNAKQVSVDLQTIRFSDTVKQKRYIFLTPRIAQQALIRFDQGLPVEPFEMAITPSQIVPIRQDARRAPRDPAKPRKYHKARLVSPGGGNVPIKVGGQSPPVAVLSSRGNTRKFGLKSLKP